MCRVAYGAQYAANGQAHFAAGQIEQRTAGIEFGLLKSVRARRTEHAVEDAVQHAG